MTLDDRAAMWEAANHAASTAKDIVRAAYELAGTAALYEQCPLERAHRDIHAVAEHIIMSEAWLAESGRVRMGAAPLAPMFAS